MAKKVIWSLNAQQDRKAIFEYWDEHNKSKAYSKKLNLLFNEAIELLEEYPYAGRKTVRANVYVRIVQQFLILYKVREDALVILNIWDGRRDRDKMP